MVSTKYFVIEEVGAFCSYCGAKITPIKGDTGIVFTCKCEQAGIESQLRQNIDDAQRKLEDFLEDKMTIAQTVINHNKALVEYYKGRLEECEAVISENIILLQDGPQDLNDQHVG